MLQWLETFVQIVEHGTVVKAAEAMHLSQPSVSRQVQQLEQQLGMPLFDRIGKRLVLNRAGELVYTYAKRSIALTQRMLDELNSLTDPELGTVYIGAGLTPSIYLLPPVLAEYRERHPRVQFTVRTGSSKETVAALIQRDVDIGLVTTFQDDTDELTGTPLFEDDLLMVASPHHPLARRGAVPYAEVAQYPFVLMRPGSGLRQMIADVSEQRGVSIATAMETDSLESINRLVQNGVGISCLPRSCVQDDLQAGRLVEIPLDDLALGSRTITLVQRRNTVLPACTRQFQAFLRQRLHRPGTPLTEQE